MLTYLKEYKRVIKHGKPKPFHTEPPSSYYAWMGRRGGRPRVPPSFDGLTAAESGRLAVKLAREKEMRLKDRTDKLDPSEYNKYQPEKETK